jgi:hypothetical protein
MQGPDWKAGQACKAGPARITARRNLEFSAQSGSSRFLLWLIALMSGFKQQTAGLREQFVGMGNMGVADLEVAMCSADQMLAFFDQFMRVFQSFIERHRRLLCARLRHDLFPARATRVSSKGSGF